LSSVIIFSIFLFYRVIVAVGFPAWRTTVDGMWSSLLPDLRRGWRYFC